MADSGYQKAVAPIKAEYRVAVSQSSAQSSAVAVVVDPLQHVTQDRVVVEQAATMVWRRYQDKNQRRRVQRMVQVRSGVQIATRREELA